MRTTLLNVTAVLALASVFAMAQHGNPPDPAKMAQHHIDFLTKQLSLTPQQQQQATTLLTEVSNNAKTIHEQMKAAHDTLKAAIQKNDSAGIEAAANNIGNLTAQMTAGHAKAMATFYQTLTPEQQTKMNELESKHGMGMHGHGGMRMHGGPDGPPPGASL
jgi:Spy/CpxP family protein refolding chaperone